MSLLMKALKKAETGKLASVEPAERRTGRIEPRLQDQGASAAAALLLAHGRRTRRERFVLVLLVLAVIAAAAIGTYVWYQTRPNKTFLPGPGQTLAQTPRAAFPAARDGALLPNAPVAAPVETPAATPEPVPAAPAKAVDAHAASSAETPVETKASVEMKRESVPRAAPRGPGASRENTPEPTPRPAYPAAIEIKISESRPSDGSRALEEAYGMLRRGKLDDADQRYSALLMDEPSSVDAWLGRATVAGQRGNRDQAREYYRRALAIAPTNATAQAGLLALDSSPTAATEDEIKRMIQQAPSASLYFALGNAYSGAGKWPEAQAAYFDAFRLDNKNPDYAFNLAVSLEHLGQTKPALDYYRRALQLAEKQSAHFSGERALQRITALQAAERL